MQAPILNWPGTQGPDSYGPAASVEALDRIAQIITAMPLLLILRSTLTGKTNGHNSLLNTAILIWKTIREFLLLILEHMHICKKKKKDSEKAECCLFFI